MLAPLLGGAAAGDPSTVSNLTEVEHFASLK